MSRPRVVAWALGATVLAGLVGLLLRPDQRPALDCEPAQVHLGADGVARCGPGAALPSAQAMTLGQRLDLNTAAAADLRLLPGVGEALAAAIIEARADAGGFDDWQQVDAISGVGPAKLELLREAFEIRRPDAGL